MDYLELTAERTRDFAGREWVFAEVSQWLQDPGGPRFLVITGEPGSGKTAIAAQLYRYSQNIAPATGGLNSGFLSAVHFCSTRDRRTLQPQSFAEMLAVQLAGRYPEFAKALVEKGSSGQIRLEVKQTIEANTGNVTGIQIHNLDLSTVQPGDAFIRAVREPLEVVCQQNPALQVVVLVDALDEALKYGKDNIGNLLAESQYMAKGVRFIVTSRPQNEILDKLRAMTPAALELPLSEGEGIAHTRQDLDAYVRQFFQPPRLSLSQGLPLEQLVQTVLERSDGNFLYARYLLEMLLARAKPIDLQALEAIPKGLDAIYREFLERLAPSNAEWDSYSPLLGTLAVVYEAQTEHQLGKIVGLGKEATHRQLLELQQLLESDPAPEPGYRLYHRSFADFLLDKKRAGRFWMDATSRCLPILERYLKVNPQTWDSYGVCYVPTHLAEALQAWDPDDLAKRHELTQQLVDLVTDPAYQQLRKSAKHRADYIGLQQDLRVAAEWAAQDPDPGSLAQVIQAALVFVAYGSTLQPSAVFDLARSGDLESAERLLGMFTAEDQWRQVALLGMAWLGSGSSPEKARALLGRLQATPPASAAVAMLLERVKAVLDQQPQPVFPALPYIPTPPLEMVQDAVARLGGQELDPEMMGLRQSFLGELMSNSQAGTDYFAREDGIVLLNFALPPQNRAEGARFFRQYLSGHASYQYLQYRNASLWILLEYLLRFPDAAWVEDLLPDLASTALIGSRADYREGLGLALLAARAKANQPGALEEFQNFGQKSLELARNLPSHKRGEGDSWAIHRRRLAALAEVNARLLGDAAAALHLLDLVSHPDFSSAFAGFKAPACLTLAEASRVCEPANANRVDELFRQALVAAHRIQDGVFCARSTARVNAMRMHWWEQPFELQAAIDRLCAEPADPRFAARHRVGEDYAHREENKPTQLKLSPELRRANTLEALAQVYQRPLPDFQRLNPQFAPGQPIPPNTLVNVPDPGFATWLAARFAAEVLTDTTLPPQQQTRLIRRLVPLALPNPTALDTVLYRLLLAAKPQDAGTLDAIAKVAPPRAENLHGLPGNRLGVV